MLKRKRKETVSSQEADTQNNSVVALINSITDAVFSIDQDGAVKTYNSAALNLLDTNEDIVGKNICDLMNLETENKKPFNVLQELAKSTTIRQRDDIIMLLPEGDQLHLEATFAPVQGDDHNGKPNSYVLVLKDITRMKSLSEEQDEFISVVSHELRTPVTIAEGSLSNAQLLAERGLEEKAREAIEEARKQVVFLSKIVNDLSTLSRAERGVTDEAEVIDVTELGDQLHEEYTPQAAEKGLRLNLDVVGKPGKVNVSRLYLQELLQNFITNAIKYTPEGSVTLRMRRQGKNIVFEVIDTGIGIGKADREKIFNRFYRAEDYRTRETNGTGLGLYISLKLARKLGSEIDVESRLNHGSTFRIILPATDTL